MTKEQALELIKRLLEQISLPKAGHIQVEQALKVIEQELKSK